MKKFLLLAVGALIFTGANAQLQRGVKAANFNQVKRVCVKNTAIAPTREMKMATAEDLAALKLAPKKAGYIEPYYKRPAGAFFSPFIAADGAGLYTYGDYVMLLTKPFGDYTWEGEAYGDDGSYTYIWQYYYHDSQYFEIGEKNLTYYDNFWVVDAPQFHMVEGDPYDENSVWWTYQLKNYTMSDDENNPVPVSETPVLVASATNDEMLASIFDDEGVEFLLSSKTMVNGGRFGNVANGSITRISGAVPYGNNEKGWWFGKNGEDINGMAQAFEKPTHPYMLKNVFLQAYPDMKVTENVKLTCKVYKLDEIPDYIDGAGVRLPEVPGELIVTGEAIVTPQTATDKNGLITFTLYGFDEDDPELTFEYTPTIDYPILVCIEGYNDPEAAGLEDFSAFVSTDWNADEGYGELAYLKMPVYDYVYDEEGNQVFEENGDPKLEPTGEHYWRGLNNFFVSLPEMKTGLTIFITVDNPYISLYYGLDNGEYTFPNEGGSFHKTYEYVDENEDPAPVEADFLALFCCYPYEDGDWTITCNGEEELPEWLHMELADLKTLETGTVTAATVEADPLPEGVKYREAVVRFEIPGDFLEYKFMQGEYVPDPTLRGDVNGDGEVNIADINALIDLILTGESTEPADVNLDGEVNIADINAVIDIILNS